MYEQGQDLFAVSKCFIHLHRSTLLISAFFWLRVRLGGSYPSSFSMVVTVFCRICSFSSSFRTTKFWASTWDCRVATWSAKTSFSSLSNFWIWLAFILCVFNRKCILWYSFLKMSKFKQNLYSATFYLLKFHTLIIIWQVKHCAKVKCVFFNSSWNKLQKLHIKL